MSSLAAARADNFYHPPDWDPRKKSRAEHAAGVTSKQDKWKAHPLRERAKKLHTEGVLTIRFEMPFNVRCVGCDNHIAKGVPLQRGEEADRQLLLDQDLVIPLPLPLRGWHVAHRPAAQPALHRSAHGPEERRVRRG